MHVTPLTGIFMKNSTITEVIIAQFLEQSQPFKKVVIDKINNKFIRTKQYCMEEKVCELTTACSVD